MEAEQEHWGQKGEKDMGELGVDKQSSSNVN